MTEKMTRYFTQERRHEDGDIASEWRTICGGHDTAYEGLHCFEEYIAAMLGKPTPEETNLSQIFLNAAVRSTFIRIAEEGVELALRVVACTQTTEVIEEPRFVKEENITPKKEIP